MTVARVGVMSIAWGCPSAPVSGITVGRGAGIWVGIMGGRGPSLVPAAPSRSRAWGGPLRTSTSYHARARFWIGSWQFAPVSQTLLLLVSLRTGKVDAASPDEIDCST